MNQKKKEPPPRKVGNYYIYERLGTGGMGSVFRARHRSLGHEVALKLLHQGGASSPENLQRFAREAEVTAKLHHPNILSLHDFGKLKSGGFYYTMELIPGDDYQGIIRKQLPSPKEAARTLLKISDAVHFAHQQGIIHRDIKPQNILINEKKEPMIMDFGLAKNVNDEASVELSHSGMVMGTLSYMSPEQLEGRLDDVNTISDVYSLGAVLYESMTGRPPFVGDNQFNLMVKIAEDDPLPPQILNPAIPIDLETICLKCLEKIPARRYQTAMELSEDITCFLEERPISAQPSTVLTRSFKFVKRNKGVVSSVFLVILALSIGLTIALYQWKTVVHMTQKAIEKERIDIEKGKALSLEHLRKGKHFFQKAVEADPNIAKNGDKRGLRKLIDEVKNNSMEFPLYIKSKNLSDAIQSFRFSLRYERANKESLKLLKKASLMHFDLALKERNFFLAAGKFGDLKMSGMQENEIQVYKKKLKNAITAREKEIESTIKNLMKDAGNLNRKKSHEEARQELISLRDPVTINLLLTYLKNKRPQVRALAIDGLAWMEDSRTVKLILPQIHSLTPEGLQNPEYIQVISFRAVCHLAPANWEILEKLRKRLLIKEKYTKRFFFPKIRDSYKKYLTKFEKIFFDSLNSKSGVLSAKKFAELGQMFMDTDKNQDAVLAFSKVLAQEPYNKNIMESRAQAYYLLGKYEKALRDVNQLIDKIPFEAKYYLIRGKIYSSQKKFKRALGDYQEAIRLGQTRHQVYYQLGLVCRNMGKYSAALQFFNDAVEKESSNENYYYHRGSVHILSGDYNKGLEDFKIMMLINPDSYISYLNVGKVYFLKGDYYHALNNLDHSLVLNPNQKLGYFLRGMVNAKRGQFKDALVDFKKIENLEIQESLTSEGGIKIRGNTDLPKTDTQYDRTHPNPELDKEKFAREVLKTGEMILEKLSEIIPEDEKRIYLREIIFIKSAHIKPVK